MKPTISVCVPTYNGARYLASCLDSVLSQKYSDFEVLIVDDCSSDSSVQIAKSYAQRDSRIRVVVNETNYGLVGNWNRCVQLSRGEWVKFVFQDDLILPDCLGQMIAVGTGSGLPIVSCARDFIFENGTAQDLQRSYLTHKAAIQTVFSLSNRRTAREFSELVLQSSLRLNLLGEPTVTLLRRNVFERFGWFNPHLRILCDLEYWARVASNTGAIHIPETLGMFRVHAGSTTAHYMQSEVRRYRFEVIDPLLIIHDYAFHPLYAALRDVARNQRPRVDLVDGFWRHALSALWFARRAAEERVNRDHSLLEEWKKVAQQYPRLSSIPIRARLLSKWRALRKAVSPK